MWLGKHCRHTSFWLHESFDVQDSACVDQQIQRGSDGRHLRNTSAKAVKRSCLLLCTQSICTCSAALATLSGSVQSSCSMCNRPPLSRCNCFSCVAAAGARQVAMTRPARLDSNCRAISRPRPLEAPWIKHAMFTCFSPDVYKSKKRFVVKLEMYFVSAIASATVVAAPFKAPGAILIFPRPRPPAALAAAAAVSSTFP